MANERRRVLDHTIHLDLSDVFFNKTFCEVKEALDDIESHIDYSKGHDCKFRVEWGYEYTDVYLDIFRDETDKEYKDRLAKEEARREKSRLASEKKKERARKILAETEEAERSEYLRLKAKYEEEAS